MSILSPIPPCRKTLHVRDTLHLQQLQLQTQNRLLGVTLRLRAVKKRHLQSPRLPISTNVGGDQIGRNLAEKTNKADDPFDPFWQFAAWYLHSQHAFLDYGNVFAYGMKYEAKKYGKLTREKFVRKYHAELKCYFAMKDNIETFDKVVPKLIKSGTLLDLTKHMNDGAGQARGNDIKGLLDVGLAYLALDLPNKTLDPKIDLLKKKEATHGHHHLTLSRLLTPVRVLADYDKNPKEYRAKLLRSAIKFNDEDFPSLLYPQPDGHDPDDLDTDLLRNHTAVRFFKHIFTSLETAVRDLGLKLKRRKGQAKINHMTEVTPGSIAYAYLMFWYNISALDDWRTEDDLMDCSELYLMILGYFEEVQDDDEGTIQWQKDTLDWWNYAVFGIIPENLDDKPEDHPTAMTLQLLHEQQARKAAAADAAKVAHNDAINPEGRRSSHSPGDDPAMLFNNELGDQPNMNNPGPR
ncbi:hypothetical protein CPB84DRAFT_1754174 [Gymnopilus junonius]|uniref:Uncharacterized protein n=1 Tax=Gymnopilus junonius TaxID=109634 RepID=A0A9P5TEQ7_GYMJU|nr:hypothetical protein CPB84DRAFT_1754174 [Gymnopilus junonius]